MDNLCFLVIIIIIILHKVANAYNSESKIFTYMKFQSHIGQAKFSKVPKFHDKISWNFGVIEKIQEKLWFTVLELPPEIMTHNFFLRYLGVMSSAERSLSQIPSPKPEIWIFEKKGTQNFMTKILKNMEGKIVQACHSRIP